MDELLTRQSKTNFGGKEARERVFRSCLTALRDIDDEVCDTTFIMIITRRRLLR